MKTMLLTCTLFLSLLGCKKVDKLTQFTVDYTETAVIPASSGINLPFNVLTPEIETNSASTFEVNDTRKDLVEEIKLTKLELTLTSPSNADFSFLESISIFMSADGLSEVKIAWEENVSQTSNSISLEVTANDLKEYIKSDKISLRLNTKTDEFLATEHHIKVYAEFFVDAKLIKD